MYSGKELLGVEPLYNSTSKKIRTITSINHTVHLITVLHRVRFVEYRVATLLGMTLTTEGPTSGLDTRQTFIRLLPLENFWINKGSISDTRGSVFEDSRNQFRLYLKSMVSNGSPDTPTPTLDLPPGLRQGQMSHIEPFLSKLHLGTKKCVY